MTQERHITVKRTARYYLVGEMTPDVEDVWFACHGYGQLAADFAREFAVIEDPKRLIIVPEALSRYYIPADAGFHGPESKVGATWMTREDREAEISDYIAYLDDLYTQIMSEIGDRRVRVTVLGFSQGGATANRWVTRGAVRVDRLLMWGCLLASDSDLNEAASFFKSVDLTLIYGTRDQFASTEMISEYEKLLAGKSVPFQIRRFEGGHRMDRQTLKELAAVESS
jgi:predicted esterase